MLKTINQNVILAEDMDYILSHLSPAEQDRIKDSTILITGSGGFLGYYFLHFFTTHAEKLGIKKIIYGRFPFTNDTFRQEHTDVEINV